MWPAVLLSELGEELPGQQRNILLAIAQGRNKKGDDIEAIEEVLAEVTAGDLFFEVSYWWRR